MKIFSNQQIKEIEKSTIELDGITELDLIERAGKGIAEEIEERWSQDKRIVVFAGWGNNGADALCASRHLLDRGYDPEIYLFNIGGNRLSPGCAENRNRLVEEYPDVNLHEIKQKFNIPELSPNSVVVDGIFGSGLNRPVPQSFVMLIRAINDSGAEVVAIDIPSGLFSEWNPNTVYDNVVHAKLTIAIEFPRLAFFIDDNADIIGQWTTVSIGLNRQAIRDAQYLYYLITGQEVKRVLRPRNPGYTKDDYGSALICAGSYGMMGAAVLATKACLKAGVGKATCFAPRCGYYIMQTAVPCAMFMPDSDDIAISEITLRHHYHAIAVGPGIGTSDITIDALENFLKEANANSRPLVLDADALNCIAMRPILLNYLPVMSVLTPHVSEFDRLFGEHTTHESRLQKAIDVASNLNVVIVLKGRYTAIVRPDGKVHINSSGNPALATAGSGDVLTGIITSFIAQGYKPEISAILGVYIHGASGLICQSTQGDYGTTAEDIVDNIGKAILSIMED